MVAFASAASDRLDTSLSSSTSSLLSFPPDNDTRRLRKASKHTLSLLIPSMDSDVPSSPAPDQPSLFRWVLGFLLVGAAWGLTTPFMRRAAVNYKPPSRPSVTDPSNPWLKRKTLGALWAVVDLLRRPAYAIPL